MDSVDALELHLKLDIINVDESMKYLIRIIVKRMEEMQLEGIDDWTNEGRIALDRKIYKTTAKKKCL